MNRREAAGVAKIIAAEAIVAYLDAGLDWVEADVSADDVRVEEELRRLANRLVLSSSPYHDDLLGKLRKL